MNDAGEVYVMGHAFADMDAVGAAAGICCAAESGAKQRISSLMGIIPLLCPC